MSIMPAGYIWKCILVLLAYVAESDAVELYERCTVDSDCITTNSSCVLSGCDGNTCHCDQGFFASYDGMSCKVAKFHGEKCDDDTDLCGGLFTTCSSRTNKCRCIIGYQLVNDGFNCAYSKNNAFKVSMNLLGESCLDSRCVFHTEQSCGSDYKCSCKDGHRPATREELNFHPHAWGQCRRVGFNLTEFNTSICGTGMLDVLDTCTYEEQCPDNAECIWLNCTSKVCACTDGYIQTADGCVQAYKEQPTGITCSSESPTESTTARTTTPSTIDCSSVGGYCMQTCPSFMTMSTKAVCSDKECCVMSTSCGEPPKPAAKYSVTKTGTDEGDTATYTCTKGQNSGATQIITCSSKSWSPPFTLNC